MSPVIIISDDVVIVRDRKSANSSRKVEVLNFFTVMEEGDIQQLFEYSRFVITSCRTLHMFKLSKV